MSIRRSLAYSFAQRYAGFVISFAATMALARLLTPAEIGVYSVGAAFVGLAQILRDFGVGRYLVQERELTEAHVQSALGVGLILGALIAGLLYLAAGPVAEFYRADELAEVLHVLSLSFLLIPFTTPAMALLERELAFNVTFRVNVLNAVAHAATGVSLAFAGFGPISLAWASLAGVTTSLLALLILRPRNVLRLPSLQHWRRVMSFGGQSSLASVIGQIAWQSPDLVIGRLLGLHSVGLYSRAQGLVQIFHQYFLRAVSDVAFPSYARDFRAGVDLKPVYLRSLSYITVVAWPFFALLFVLAEPVLAILFGDQWLPAAPLVKALCLAGVTSTAWSLAPDTMISMGRVRNFLKLVLIMDISRICLIVAAAAIFNSLVLVTWAQFLASCIGLLIVVRFLNHALSITFSELFLATRGSAFIAVVLLSTTYLTRLGFAFSGIVLETIIVVIVAFTTYSVLLFVMDHPIKRELKTLRNYLSSIWLRNRTIPRMRLFSKGD